MRHDPAAPYFPIYFIIWALLGLIGTLWIRSRPTPQEKKKWFDRFVIVMGIFIAGFTCFVAVLWKQYLIIPFVLVAGSVISILNIRNVRYCEECGKKSSSRTSSYCPHCGHYLK